MRQTESIKLRRISVQHECSTQLQDTQHLQRVAFSEQLLHGATFHRHWHSAATLPLCAGGLSIKGAVDALPFDVLHCAHIAARQQALPLLLFCVYDVAEIFEGQNAL